MKLIKLANKNKSNDFASTAEAMERSFKSAPFPLDPRSAGRPKKGEVVEESETLSVRLPKGMIDQITNAAHTFGMSRNRFIKTGIARMIEDPVTEGALECYRLPATEPAPTFEVINIYTITNVSARFGDIVIKIGNDDGIRPEKSAVENIPAGYYSEISMAGGF